MIEPDEEFEWVETLSDDDGDDYYPEDLPVFIDVSGCPTCIAENGS